MHPNPLLFLRKLLVGPSCAEQLLTAPQSTQASWGLPVVAVHPGFPAALGSHTSCWALGTVSPEDKAQRAALITETRRFHWPAAPLRWLLLLSLVYILFVE